MTQDHSPQSLSRELNNIGASFQDRGYDEDAEAMYCDALELMFQIAGNAVEISEQNITHLTEKIAKSKEKLADLLPSDKMTIEEQLLDPHQTLMLSDALRIEDTNDAVTSDSETRKKINSAIILYNYGAIYHKNGHGVEATKLFKMSQELSFQHVGDDELMAIACMAALNNVGHSHVSDGRIGDGLRAFSEAEELAWNCFRSTLNDDTSSRDIDNMEIDTRSQGTYKYNPVIFKYVATILFNKGQAHLSKGEFEEACRSFKKAIKFSRTAPLIHGIANALNDLGRDYQGIGMIQNALRTYQCALETRKAFIKITDCASLPNVYYTILINIGDLLYHEGDHKRALHALKLSLTLQCQSCDSLRPEIASAIHAIGVIQLNIGNFAEALNASKKAAAIRRTIFGSENLLVAESLSLLGRVYFESKKYAKAFQVYLEVLQIEEAVFGSNHADVTETLCRLGLVSRLSGGLEIALFMYSKALCIMRQSFGQYHPTMAQVVHVIGDIHLDRGDYHGAFNAYQEYSSLLMRSSQLTENSA